MHGPFVKLIEKIIGVCGFYAVPQKDVEAPCPAWREVMDTSVPVGLAVHRENKMIIGFRFARIFWDLTLQEKFWDLSLKESSET